MFRFNQQFDRAIIVRGETPFTVLTGVAIATLYFYYEEGADETIARITRSIREQGLAPSPTFNAIFGHGFGLRDSLASMVAAGHPSLQDWPGFISWLETNDERWWRSVAEASIHTGLDFAGETIPEGGISLTSDDLIRYYADAMAAPALGAPASAIAAILASPGVALRNDVLTTLYNIQPLLPVSNIHLDHLSGDASTDHHLENVFSRITGRQMPPSESRRLASLPRLIFLATGFLNNEISISYFIDTAVIAFEPAAFGAAPARDMAPGTAALFSALGNVQRLRILQALATNVEMYGLQLAEELDIPQATVSNHLAVLQAAGLIGSRPTGRRILYSISSGGLERAIRILNDLTTSSTKGHTQ